MIRGAVTREDLTALLAVENGPCLSLYQPTHRRHPENQQDPVRYKNLLKSLEESLLRQHSAKEAEALLAPFRELGEDKAFWNHTWDGLAVVGSPEFFRVFRLQRPVLELAVVANSFHIKPLLRVLQSADRYQVLSLNRRDVKLFEGNRDQLDEIELVTEGLGLDLGEPHQGLGDEERFFREVDRAVLEHQAQASGLPVIVAALAQHQATFRKVSHNPQLAPAGIEGDPNALSVEDLRRQAWAIAEPEFRARLTKLADQFEAARARGLGSDDLATVGHAAAESRVGSLWVEAGRWIPGRLNPDTGEITAGTEEDPQTDDLLDDVAELVLRRGGEVLVVPPADMPVTTGVAGTFRF